MTAPQALDVDPPPPWEREATPVRTITPADSAAFYARRAAPYEDPPDGCDWCGDRSFRTGHRACPEDPRGAIR